MGERKGAVTLHGKPMTLVGPQLKAGDRAPQFSVVDAELKPVGLDFLKGKIAILCSVPSLDTPVCDRETRRFNQSANDLGDDVRIGVISMDLPFAQKRWCGAAGVERVTTLSDHVEASFGKAYGVLIKELRLLARAVFVLDRDGIIRYAQLVPEATQEPDYDKALTAARNLL